LELEKEKTTARAKLVAEHQTQRVFEWDPATEGLWGTVEFQVLGEVRAGGWRALLRRLEGFRGGVRQRVV
jgi:hypothetical protein